MYRRVAALAALAVAGLTASAPLASAAPLHAAATDPAPSSDQRDPRAPGDPAAPGGNGNVSLLNGLNLIPVQACGLQLPILSGVLDAPDGQCSVDAKAPQH